MYDEGIPEREHWPEGVLDAIREFRQGDVISGLPLVYWADPKFAVHARTRFYAAQGYLDEGPVDFGDEVAPYGIITTQTCDLAQEGDRKPNSAWVQLAPVFNGEAPRTDDPDQKVLEGQTRSLIKDGKDQYRLWVPNVPADGFWYADLTFEVAVERGWLAGKARIDGFGDESAREEVGRRLAWLRSRPAFDTKFVKAVQQPMVSALRDLRKADRTFYRRMHEQVVEIGVLLNARLAVGQAEVVVLHTGIDADVFAWWRALWDTLKQNAQAAGFNLFPLRLADLAVLPAGEYRRMTRLPLASISPHPAWYGEDPEALPEPQAS